MIALRCHKCVADAALANVELLEWLSCAVVKGHIDAELTNIAGAQSLVDE